jgi:hypothetical protein
MTSLIGQNPATFESYLFYKGTVELRYNDHLHQYLRIVGNKMFPIESVTTIVRIPDKSERLIPWSAKVMGEKLIGQLPIVRTQRGQLMVSAMPYERMFTLIADSKSAHKDRLNEAADIGKQAHRFLEQHILFELGRLAQPPVPPTDPQVLSCIEGAYQWMDQHRVIWTQTERKVFSWRWQFAGTMDGLCFVNSCDDPLCCPTPFENRLSLIDFKSSNFLSESFVMQVSAYVAAIHEEWDYDTTIEMPRIQDRWLIRMAKTPPEGSEKLFETWHMEAQDQDRDFAAFLVCLDLTRTMKDIKARMAEVMDARKQRVKLQRVEESRAKKMKDCGKKDYQGKRSAKPKCIDGLPCEKCFGIWLTNHPEGGKVEE